MDVPPEPPSTVPTNYRLAPTIAAAEAVDLTRDVAVAAAAGWPGTVPAGGPAGLPVGTFVGPDTNPDEYQLLSLVGAGGEAHVWRAITRPDAGSPAGIAVAVKIFARDVDPAAEQDWLRRTQAMRHLHNPGMARVHAAFVGAPMHPAGVLPPSAEPRQRYLVMELVDGPSLLEWVEDHPDAPFRERIRLLTTLAAGLDALHAGSSTVPPVAHGDVKPDNARLAADGGIKLVDFGLMRMRGTSRWGPAMASLPYTAPELFSAGPHAMPTLETDRFSFAATAFHVLTGVTPPLRADRRGPDPAAMLPILERSPLTGGRPEVAATLMAGLAPDPAGRPARLVPWLAAARRTESGALAGEHLSAASPGWSAVAATAAWPGSGSTPLVAASPPGPDPARRPERRAGGSGWLAWVAVALVVAALVALGKAFLPGSGNAPGVTGSGPSAGATATAHTAGPSPAGVTGAGRVTSPTVRVTAAGPAAASRAAVPAGQSTAAGTVQGALPAGFQRRTLADNEELDLATGVIGTNVTDEDLLYWRGSAKLDVTANRVAMAPPGSGRAECLTALRDREDSYLVPVSLLESGKVLCLAMDKAIGVVRLASSDQVRGTVTLDYLVG